MPARSGPPGCSFFLFCEQASGLERQIAAISQQRCAITDCFVFYRGGAPAQFQESGITWINYFPETQRERFALAGLACGEFVCLLDSDFVPHETWIDEISKAQKHYDACIVEHGEIFVENPEAFAMRLQRDCWCDTGKGWLFFPTAWLPQLTPIIARHGELKDISIVCPGNGSQRNVRLVKPASSLVCAGLETKASEQAIHILISSSHKNPARALLSLAGQTYRNWQCTILAANHNPAIERIIAKIDPRKAHFRIVEPPDPANLRSGDIGLALEKEQWLAHPDVLRQVNENLRVCDTILRPLVSFSEAAQTGSRSASHFAAGFTGCIAYSPDLSFITGSAEIPCRPLPGANSPLPIMPVGANQEPACAIATVITPDYLPDALLSLGSYARNCKFRCDAYIFIATSDPAAISQFKATVDDSFFHLLFPGDFIYQKLPAKGMQRRYSQHPNEYRWGMKAVVLAELLARGYHAALHLDPDIYAVSDISDIHANILKRALSIFPHFRDPDNESTRKFLYQDGFFNGGMLGATRQGLKHLNRLTERCLKEMKRDRINNLFDDQKYYELFVLECDDLFVNHDKGINYSLWNSEPVEGLIAPSQRSFLLRSGDFVRIWHIHSDLIRSVAGKQDTLPDLRLTPILYLLALLHAALLACCLNPQLTCLLGARLRHIGVSLSAATPDNPGLPYLKILEHIHAGLPKSQLVRELAETTLNSAGFDNFELYSRMLLWLAPESGERDRIITDLRANDFRYVSESGRQPDNMDIARIQAIQAQRARRIFSWLNQRRQAT